MVDFFPDDIADFAAPHRSSDYEVLSDYEESECSDIETSGTGDLQWEWRFFLLVEDAGPAPANGQQRAQMQLLVAEQDGDYLLDMEASDLHQDPQQVARLREKLFVLWGDLQERKEAVAEGETITSVKPLAKPFECLIKEYGVPARTEGCKAEEVSDFERMFRIWGTSVK